MSREEKIQACNDAAEIIQIILRDKMGCKRPYPCLDDYDSPCSKLERIKNLLDTRMLDIYFGRKENVEV